MYVFLLREIGECRTCWSWYEICMADEPALIPRTGFEGTTTGRPRPLGAINPSRDGSGAAKSRRRAGNTRTRGVTDGRRLPSHGRGCWVSIRKKAGPKSTNCALRSGLPMEFLNPRRRERSYDSQRLDNHRHLLPPRASTNARQIQRRGNDVA